MPAIVDGDVLPDMGRMTAKLAYPAKLATRSSADTGSTAVCGRGVVAPNPMTTTTRESETLVAGHLPKTKKADAVAKCAAELSRLLVG
jgi:hypothetical protein